ncbi:MULTISPECIES: hypothetical protein [unclassified Sinorhizobium]|uniref:hypothetical protein n=1 Tax=unclassified Sinorhizobium TaxID=2613772 RepID=UPI00352604E0
MTTMIERVARAIMEDSGGGRDRPDFNWRYYESAARAAIEAMREPTEDMRIAGCQETWLDPSVDDIYRAMIDAALQEDK